jgi:hypothetical protein
MSLKGTSLMPSSQRAEGNAMPWDSNFGSLKLGSNFVGTNKISVQVGDSTEVAQYKSERRGWLRLKFLVPRLHAQNEARRVCLLGPILFTSHMPLPSHCVRAIGSWELHLCFLPTCKFHLFIICEPSEAGSSNCVPSSYTSSISSLCASHRKLGAPTVFPPHMQVPSLPCVRAIGSWELQFCSPPHASSISSSCARYRKFGAPRAPSRCRVSPHKLWSF